LRRRQGGRQRNTDTSGYSRGSKPNQIIDYFSLFTQQTETTVKVRDAKSGRLNENSVGNDATAKPREGCNDGHCVEEEESTNTAHAQRYPSLLHEERTSIENSQNVDDLCVTTVEVGNAEECVETQRSMTGSSNDAGSGTTTEDKHVCTGIWCTFNRGWKYSGGSTGGLRGD